MRKDMGAKPCIYPEPVLIIATYDENGVPNAMNAAWGGIHDDTEIFMCLSPDHKTVKNLKERKAFTVSFATKETLVGSDYVGIVSGNDVSDKFERAGFHAEKSDKVDAPMIKELPVCLECRLISFKDEKCECVGEIVNLSIDDSVMTDGKLDLKKFHPIIYDGLNHDYYTYGEVVGKAFSDGKRLK